MLLPDRQVVRGHQAELAEIWAGSKWGLQGHQQSPAEVSTGRIWPFCCCPGCSSALEHGLGYGVQQGGHHGGAKTERQEWFSVLTGLSWHSSLKGVCDHPRTEPALYYRWIPHPSQHHILHHRQQGEADRQQWINLFFMFAFLSTLNSE